MQAGQLDITTDSACLYQLKLDTKFYKHVLILHLGIIHKINSV